MHPQHVCVFQVGLDEGRDGQTVEVLFCAYCGKTDECANVCVCGDAFCCHLGETRYCKHCPCDGYRYQAPDLSTTDIGVMAPR